MELVGIIQVPLSAFVYNPDVGRLQHPALVKKLSRVFRRTRCTPENRRNHAEGLIDSGTLTTILSQLKSSVNDLRSTVKHETYPRVLLRRCILCVDGKQRIAAAEKMFGSEYWWTVRLYYAPQGFPRGLVSRQTRTFSHETEYSDGEIYRHLRQDQIANRLKAAQEWRVQLSPCKEKILNQLLKQQRPPEEWEECIVQALDSLIPYPGVWEGLELGNWHRYLALHWPEPIIHFLRKHLLSTYERIVDRVPHAKQHFDVATVRCLALRCPSSQADAVFIRKKMDRGEMFRGLTDTASRRQILDNILSIDTIIPSLKTFHENMKYFAIGAKILRYYIMLEDNDPEVNGQSLTLQQKVWWSRPDRPTIEAGSGTFLPLQDLDFQLALKLLFLIAIRPFASLSTDQPKQDVRGQTLTVKGKTVTASPDAGCVYLLQKGARQLGFSSRKIDEGLAGRQPVSRVSFDVPDGPADSKWKCGRPGLRAYFHLQEHAFLPSLVHVDGEDGPVPMFVFRDFIDAFFGNDAFMMDVADPGAGPDPPPPALQDRWPASDQPAADLYMEDADDAAAAGVQPMAASRRRETPRGRPVNRRHHTEAGPSSRSLVRSGSPRTKRNETRRSPIRSQVEPRTTAPAGDATDTAVPVDSTVAVAGTADRNTARRSPVAPPDLYPQAPSQASLLRKDGPVEPRKKSRPRRTPVRYFVGTLDTTRPSQHKKSGQRVDRIRDKEKKRGRTVKSNRPDQDTKANVAFASQPQISSTNTRSPVFAPAPAVNERKRDVAHLETLPRLRDWMTGSVPTAEPPRHRTQITSAPAADSRLEPASDRHTLAMGDETAHTGPGSRESTALAPAADTNQTPGSNQYGLTNEMLYAESDSQESTTNPTSLRPARQQRSPVGAPVSGPNSPPGVRGPPRPESEATHEAETGLTATDEPQTQAQSSSGKVPSRRRRGEARPEDEAFHNVETFSETRTQSPGTYGVDDWLKLRSSARSPVATPDSDSYDGIA